MPKEFCLKFLQQAIDGQEANELAKEKFIASIKAAHAEGLYLAFSKRDGWKFSNKNPDRLASQIRDLDSMVNTLFKKVSDS